MKLINVLGIAVPILDLPVSPSSQEGEKVRVTHLPSPEHTSNNPPQTPDYKPARFYQTPDSRNHYNPGRRRFRT